MVFAILFSNIACDQITKEIARENLKGHGIIKVAGNLFVLKYTENNGAFLGFGSSISQPYKSILFIYLPLFSLLSILAYILYNNNKLSLYQIIGFSLIIGGGIGNMADRILNNGYVPDFMIFGIGALHTGILNIADVSITFGAFIILAIEIFKYKSKIINRNISTNL